MSKEILILGKEAFDKLKPDVQRFIKQQSQHIADLMSKLAESEERLKEELVEKKGLERALSVCNRQNDEFADMIKKLVSEKEELKHQLEEKEFKEKYHKKENKYGIQIRH